MKLQHSPSASREVHQCELIFVFLVRERFDKDVRAVIFGTAVRSANVARRNVVADEMVANVYVLQSHVKLMIVSEGDGGGVVGADVGRSGRRDA